MPREVSADFIDMHLSARRLDDWCSDSSEVFDRGHRALESAAGGWVGESAAALSVAAAKIRASQQAVTARLADHSSGISSVAHALQQQDVATRNELLKLDSSPATPTLNLGL